MTRAAGGATLALVLVAALLAGSPAPATAQQVSLPGGKANWVVSVGGLNTVQANNYRNWVRIGYYVFDTDGTARTNFWTWNQRDEPVRVDTVLADCPAPVPDCHVKTVEGFTGGPTGGFTGTFQALAGGQVQVSWTHRRDGSQLSRTLQESWTIDTGLAGGTLARIASPTFRTGAVPAPGEFSNYSATFGVGWGSNATFDRWTRASMTELRTDPDYHADPYRGRYHVANRGVVRQERAGFGPIGSGADDPDDPNFQNPWQVCASGACLGWVQRQSGCNCGESFPDRDRVRYLAEIGGGRRNIQWYWCQCLAQGQDCYRANSHPQPMLQIIDDNGQFRGWVGVEAFTHVHHRTLVPDQDYANGYWAVFEMTEFTQYH